MLFLLLLQTKNNTPAAQEKCISRLLLYHFCVNLPVMILSYPIFKSMGMRSSLPLPSWYIQVLYILKLDSPDWYCFANWYLAIELLNTIEATRPVSFGFYWWMPTIRCLYETIQFFDDVNLLHLEESQSLEDDMDSLIHPQISFLHGFDQSPNVDMVFIEF